jgi:hypothetical protein
MKDLIEKYDELYEDMATAKDPRKMMIFGDAERWMFHSLAKKHPEIAEMWLTKLEAGKWNNYLSRTEAMEIANKLINQDGTRGAHWSYETFKAAVESLGASMTEEPFYNCWALWIQANAEYSDHHKSASEFVPKDQEPRYFYMMAVEKLKDVDYPRFIRKYYDL